MVGLFSLLPAIVDTVKVPVVATGPEAVGVEVVLFAAPSVVEVTLMSTWQLTPGARLATSNAKSISLARAPTKRSRVA